MFAAALWLAGCSRSYQTPDFSTDSRDAIAASIEDVRLSLNEALEWAPESICRIGRCESLSGAQCLGDARQAARIRYTWLSCLTDPIRDRSAAESGLQSPQPPAFDDEIGEPGQRGDVGARIEFVDCRPQESARYLESMATSPPVQRDWLREQLELVDQIRQRLRREFPQQINDFRRAVGDLDVRISTLRARYQAEMSRLRSDGAPGEVIGTWEDRYQTAATDLSALEEGLASLRDAVDSSSDFARRRFAEAASRIAASGFETWNPGNCEITE